MKGTVVESNSSIWQVRLTFPTFVMQYLILSIIGEAMKQQFEGITPSDSQTESCFVRSNGLFTAVIYLFHVIYTII